MEVADLDGKSFQMLHSFHINNKIVAEGTSRGIILSKTGVIAPTEVMKKVTERLNKNAT